MAQSRRPSRPVARRPARPAPKANARVSAKDAERAEAIRDLKTMLRPGDTVYYIIRSVSRTGMSRDISFHTFPCVKGRAQPRQLTWLFSRVIGYGKWVDGNLRVGGAGMDMGFKVIYDVSRILFRGKTGVTHMRGASGHEDPGYALKHEQL